MSALRNAGERIGRYSLAKRQAVQQEDFIAAKLRKEQMELYRKMVYDQLHVKILLESNGMINENDKISEVYAQKPTLPSPPSLQDVAGTLTNDTTFAAAVAVSSPQLVRRENSASEVKSPNSMSESRQSPQLGHVGLSPRRSPNIGSMRRRNKSTPRSTFEDYEERAIPTLRQ